MARITTLPALLALLAASGCAVNAGSGTECRNEIPLGSQEALDACNARQLSSAPFLALKHRVGLPSERTPAMKANPDRATPSEVAQLLDYNLNYLAPCVKFTLQAVDAIHPALVAILARGFARSDANVARLVTRQISWGELLRENDALGVQAEAELEMARTSIRSGSVGRDAHALEAARRQATMALQEWLERHQALRRLQLRIDPKSRPPLTSCRYIGATLDCATE